jgi:hypothetical protein
MASHVYYHSMRDMAKIVTVKAVTAIPDKDRVQLLTFNENGYTVIGDKSIQKGQRVVFVEVDSLLPLRPEFEFLRARCYKECLNRFLIRPMRMCGTISMGIVFNTDILPTRKKPYMAGEDVSAALDILKYEPEESAPQVKTPNIISFLMKHKVTRGLGKKILKLINRKNAPQHSAFPGYLIGKSDETTIQNCPEMLENHLDTASYATIKMEGQSATFLYDYKRMGVGGKIGKFFVCSRSVSFHDRKKKDSTRFWNYADENNIAALIMDYYKKTEKLLAIQGELCGPGIQKNIYRFSKHILFIYTAKNVITNDYLSFDELRDFSKVTGFTLVPVVKGAGTTSGGEGVMGGGSGTIKEWVNVPLRDIISDVKDADQVSRLYFKLTPEGIDYHYNLKSGEKAAFEKNGIYFHEGIVIRGMKQEFSFKIKSPDYAFWFS